MLYQGDLALTDQSESYKRRNTHVSAFFVCIGDVERVGVVLVSCDGVRWASMVECGKWSDALRYPLPLMCRFVDVLLLSSVFWLWRDVAPRVFLGGT